MSMSVRVEPFPLVLTAALAACGGGGAGSTIDAGPMGMEAQFSSFSAARPNQTLVMPGISQTGSGTASAFDLDPVSDSSTAKLSFDGERKLSGMSLLTPHSSVTLGTATRCLDSGGACAAIDADGTARGLVMDPYAPRFDWNYQSFGIWAKDTGPTSFQAGAMSAGAVTPGSAVPTMSSATFLGHASGFYFDGAGNRFTTDAGMRALADFGNRNIQFSTSGTLLTDTRTFEPATPNPGLDLSGTLFYAPGASQFSGGVKNSDNTLSGSASGRFYGPTAEEIGGVYGLGSASGASMVGGFGGKKVAP